MTLWPDALAGLGPLVGGRPFGLCRFCPEPKPGRDPEAEKIPRGSFVTCGGLQVCAHCASILARMDEVAVRAAVETAKRRAAA